MAKRAQGQRVLAFIGENTSQGKQKRIDYDSVPPDVCTPRQQVIDEAEDRRRHREFMSLQLIGGAQSVRDSELRKRKSI
jgi:hypothetical protein